MPRATASDGVGLHYHVVGESGPWVVFIQGLSLSGRFWFDIPERVSRTYGVRSIVLDNRGIGRSDRVSKPFSMRTMADDVAAVLDHAGAERATVVGISMGGMIAQNVAILHPRRTEALCLFATTAGLPLGKLPGPRALQLLVQIPFAKGRAGGALAAELLLPPGKRAQAEQLFSRWPDAFAQDPQEPRSFFLQIGAILRHSTGARLSSISAPTSVVAGAADILVLPVNSERIAAKIPGAELELIPDVGHSIFTEDPQAMDRALTRVWRRLGRA
jgi:3-oxoadipate enol-lactonase